ncbi:MAG: DUF721 domain-containing protein [Gammaproteobacteria bacterium]|nr:DUF721 domain-containing protein [Gammaproteobacteria bacterium]
MHPLNRLLAPRLLEQARLLERLNFSLRGLLPAPLGEHCWAAGIRDQELTLVTDASTWASQLRYLQREILKQINAEYGTEYGLALKKCRVRIAAPRLSREPVRHRLTLSPESGRALERAAGATEDPELRAALQKLARRAPRGDD